VSGPRRLPGDAPADEIVRRIIRVDHAGEYGAARIYAGQLAVLGHSPVAPVLRHMEEQEKRHLAAFDALVAQRRVRPTALSPLWHAAGWPWVPRRRSWASAPPWHAPPRSRK
jgi:ubiquinone biosynthesis monooxygenase Coq7